MSETLKTGFLVSWPILLQCMYITAVREDRSPGGKHRVKRPRLEDIGVVDLNKKMEDVHLELIEKLMEAHPDRIPGSTSGR